ncbi:MAG: DsrE family protein [Candidatus Bathyarchaeia archaeon]
MNTQLCIVIRHGPYGMIHAAEALRVAGGTTINGLQTNILLIEDGVFVAKEDQNAEKAGWRSLHAVLKQFLALFGHRGLRVYVHEDSARTRGLETGDFVGGVEILPAAETAKVVSESDVVAMF